MQIKYLDVEYSRQREEQVQSPEDGACGVSQQGQGAVTKVE